MQVAKITVKKQDHIVQLIKVGSVQFDPKPGWMLISDLDRPWFDVQLRWVHPEDVFVHWIKEFSFDHS